ncbi:MAG: methyltransferase domain-containing protein [Deltaproteobacteria bacterium]|nr:methyltransferase domain-containing protein [Deltaproteobacteria bacterium]
MPLLNKTSLRKVLPDEAWSIARDTFNRVRKFQRKFERRPCVGWVRFGSLRRVDPIDPNFGFRYGTVIDRYYIQAFLSQQASDIRGHVLEVENNAYTRRFGGARVSRSDVLHYTEGNPKATIVADLTDAREILSDTFDCIILTQTLQFIYDMRAAINTLHRILRPGGVVLATCHGISQISGYDMDNWGEYWRLTGLSGRKLFMEVFPTNCVTVQAYGNVLAVTAFLHGLTAQELRREELDYQDPRYEVIVAIRAVSRLWTKTTHCLGFPLHATKSAMLAAAVNAHLHSEYMEVTL